MLNLRNQRLLVIAPHPDDEVLGCGGLIHKIKQAGGKVFVLFLSIGSTVDFSKKGKSSGSEREKEIEKVMAFLRVDGYDIAFRGNEYHLRMDNVPAMDLIGKIEKSSNVSIGKVRPSILAVTQASDYNQDHRAAWNAAIAATRPAPPELKQNVGLVLGYEFSANAWSVSDVKTPNMFVPLSDSDLNAKIKAMRLYSSQVRLGPHTRSEKTIEYFAKVRGANPVATRRRHFIAGG